MKDHLTGHSSATFGDDDEPLATLDQRYDYAERLTPRLLAVARGLLPPHEDPRDFVQETLARVHKSPDDLTAERFEAWLFTTLRRVIIDAHRRAPTADDLSRAAYAEPRHTPDLAERVCDRAEAIWLDEQAARVLPEKRRAVVGVLKDGGSVPAVAAELGASYVVAQNEVARTRRPLRDLLARSRHVSVLPGARAVRLRRWSRRVATGAVFAPALVIATVAVLPLLPRPHPNDVIEAETRDAGYRPEVLRTPSASVLPITQAGGVSVALPTRTPPVVLPTTPGNTLPTPLHSQPAWDEGGNGAPPATYLVWCARNIHVGTDYIGCPASAPSPAPSR